jgi:nicotinate-nucleotide pyrophosphorylase (carboxylating)
VRAASAVESLIELALAEDIGAGDLTTEAIVAEDAQGTADVVFRSAGVVCGLDAAHAVLRRLDPDVEMEVVHAEGSWIASPPTVVARFRGAHRALLTGERTALNLLQRLSGIATTAHAYVAAVAGTGAEILDTRKTSPGLRALDKHAVACGGAVNHREGLFDAILIKDNHVAIAGGVAAAVRAVRERHAGMPVEVEVDTLEQLDEALAEGPETILLDNMAPPQLREAVARTEGRARLEASGGITLDTVRAVAESGVDAISVGALTHSVIALDVALEVSPSQP